MRYHRYYKQPSTTTSNLITILVRNNVTQFIINLTNFWEPLALLQTGGRIQTWAVELQACACPLVFSERLNFWRLESLGKEKARILSMCIKKTPGMNSNSKLDTQPWTRTLTAAGVRESAAAPRDSTSVFRH